MQAKPGILTDNGMSSAGTRETALSRARFRPQQELFQRVVKSCRILKLPLLSPLSTPSKCCAKGTAELTKRITMLVLLQAA